MHSQSILKSSKHALGDRRRLNYIFISGFQVGGSGNHSRECGRGGGGDRGWLARSGEARWGAEYSPQRGPGGHTCHSHGGHQSHATTSQQAKSQVRRERGTWWELTCTLYRRQPPVERPPAPHGIKDSSQLRTAETRGERPPSVINGVSCPAKTKHCS